MTRKQIQICNVEDTKDLSGLWLQSYYTEPLVQCYTRAGMLWKGIGKRCKIGGFHQNTSPTYIGITNGFKSFQDFAEWATNQYGYLHKDKSGMYWQLDKDLKVYGNKEYNSETCIFVPQRVNSLLLTSNNSRGDWPIGVTYRRNARKFQVMCGDGEGKQKYLGMFECPFIAHKAWQRYKIEVIQKAISEDYEIKNHPDLVTALNTQIQRIQNDLTLNRETL